MCLILEFRSGFFFLLAFKDIHIFLQHLTEGHNLKNSQIFPSQCKKKFAESLHRIAHEVWTLVCACLCVCVCTHMCITSLFSTFLKTNSSVYTYKLNCGHRASSAGDFYSLWYLKSIEMWISI